MATVQLLLSQNAPIPISYVPLDNEFQKEPFIPFNYGVCCFPFSQESRNEMRMWLRNSFSEEFIPIERQIDFSTYQLGVFCFPFSHKTGLLFANKLIQHVCKDDFIESIKKDSVEIVQKEWDFALKNLSNESSNLTNEEVSNGYKTLNFANSLLKIRKELNGVISLEAIKRFIKAYGEISAFHKEIAGIVTDDAFFDRFVDEYHFMRFRAFDGYLPFFTHLAELSAGYSLSEEQAESALIKEYTALIAELILLINDFVSFEKERRDGRLLNMIAFMRSFYNLDWKGALVKAHMFYFTLLDKLEDLLAEIYASEWGKDVELMRFLEIRKLELTGDFLTGMWMMRFNHYLPKQQYSWMHQKIFPVDNGQYCENVDKIREFNQQFMAYWATVSDPFEGAEKIASEKGFEKYFKDCDWKSAETDFSKLWFAKGGEVGLSGPFAGYDPSQPDKNTFPETVERFKKVYVWSGETQRSWQRECLHKYVEKKFGSADWLARWQTSWRPEYINSFYQQ